MLQSHACHVIPSAYHWEVEEGPERRMLQSHACDVIPSAYRWGGGGGVEEGPNAFLAPQLGVAATGRGSYPPATSNISQLYTNSHGLQNSSLSGDRRRRGGEVQIANN